MQPFTGHAASACHTMWTAVGPERPCIVSERDTVLNSSPSLVLFRNGFEKRAAGVPSKRGRKRVYRHEKNQVSTSISQWEHFLSRRGLQGRDKDGPGPCSANENDWRRRFWLKARLKGILKSSVLSIKRDTLLKLYSLNLNQWIITNVSAKYATDNQWMKCEILNLAGWSLLCNLINLVLMHKFNDIRKLKLMCKYLIK